MSIEKEFPALQLMIDVGVGYVLFQVANYFAVFVENTVTPDQSWLHLTWFTIGLLPLVCYLQYRGICRFTRWDLLLLAPIPSIVGVSSLLIGVEASSYLVFPLALISLVIRILFVPKPTPIEKR
ncbi:hypothetical protein C5Y96_10735 [Blastopirellula marina]|uniref:Uncharacterized protein n=1 Tax=Blastopirellula marina TaxID=124 RepID=A0A2S8FMA4_9BACT|nr:hypothetical protein C5Y96_10735 [Blastopirellula marina]RCS52408.1 hypothetical protein DTL36_10745 [Bremerella cremea]